MADERIEIEKELRDVRNELDKVLDVSAVRPITAKHMKNVTQILLVVAGKE